MSDTERRVRISSSCSGDPSSVTIQHVDPDAICGVVNGCQWFGVTDGKEQYVPRYKELPEPVDDEQMLPFAGRGRRYKHEIIERLTIGTFPHITIQSLCGYNYTPAIYRIEAKKLEQYGFICCRSKRGEDGCFWELWYLSGDYVMRGELEQFYKSLPSSMGINTKWHKVVDWLCKHVSFGTLDVSCQRACMVIDGD